jgi:amino acid transporter
MTETKQPAKTGGTGLRAGALGVPGIVVLSVVLMGPAISLFFNTPVMASTAGAAVPLAFVLSMIGILFTAWTVAQYGRKIATAGSFYGFVVRSGGKSTGFLAGWCTFGAYLGAAIGGVAITGAFISSIVQAHFAVNIPWFWAAVATLIAVVAISYFGIRLSERLSVVMLSIEVISILIVLVVIFAKGGAHGYSPKPFSLSGSPDGFNGIRLAMVFGILSFVGFEISATLSEETRNPKRSIPLAVLGCTLVVGILYVVGSYGVVLGYGLGNTGKLATDASAFDTLARMYVSWLRPIVDLLLINALLGATLAITNSFARVAFALGRDGVIPKWLGSTHPRFRTPYAALAAFAVVTLVALIPLAATGVPGLTAYAYISTPASLLLIVVFIGANLLLWRLYRNDYAGEFSWWKHLAFPITGSAVLLLPLIAQFYPVPPHPLNLLPIFAGAWILIGILILVTGGQRVHAASGAFLDSQSASALTAPEERP